MLTRNLRLSAAMPGLRSLPPSVGTVEIQKTRVLQRLRAKGTDLDRYEVCTSHCEPSVKQADI